MRARIKRRLHAKEVVEI